MKKISNKSSNSRVNDDDDSNNNIKVLEYSTNKKACHCLAFLNIYSVFSAVRL